MDSVLQLFSNNNVDNSMGVISNFSYKVVILEKYMNKRGRCALCLRVIIKRKFKDIPLGLHIEPYLFNKLTGLVEKTEANKPFFYLSDQELSDFNLMIQNEVGKATNIFVEYRLSRREPELQDFVRQYTNYERRDSFLFYFETDVNSRKKSGEIAEHTADLHLNTCKLLKEFKGEIRFMDINLKLIQDFDRWLEKTKEHNNNTRAREHGDVRQYINRAINAGMRIVNPYKDFKGPIVTDSIVFLEQEELIAWTDYYFSKEIKANHKKSLQCFLGMCYLSLRVSDMLSAKKGTLIGDELVFIPEKTANTKGKILRVPVTEMARKFFNVDEEYLFPQISDATINRHIKKIAEHLVTDKEISTRVGRHTYATIFLERGGSVEVLQQILGHSDIEDTMVYVHITNERKNKQATDAFRGFHHEKVNLWDHIPMNTRKKGSGIKKIKT